jgi:D-alanine-D-alanine ligase
MTSFKKKIAVIAGGDSSEEVISVKSASYIMDKIDGSKYHKYLVYVKGNEWKVMSGKTSYMIDKNHFSFYDGKKMHKLDAAYLIVHGAPAENGKIQGYLEMMGIPFVGPDVLQASMTFNKDVCKKLLGTIGIKSSKSVLIEKGKEIIPEQIAHEIGMPCFVKPNNSGSSFGITKVYHVGEIANAINHAFTEDNMALVEKFLDGTEVTCGVYALNGKINVLPVTEIVSTTDFFDYEAKYTIGGANEITPARISEELTQQCQQLTYKIFEYLNLKGLCRIDYIIADNEINLLEVNTIPGMAETSIVPQQIRAAGYNETEFITQLVDDIFDQQN